MNPKGYPAARPEKDFFVKLQTEIGCTTPIEKASSPMTNTDIASSASGYVCTFDNYGSTRWFNVKENKQ